MKNFIVTKARNDENTKGKKNFVLSRFRVFVINPFGFRLVRVRFQIINFIKLEVKIRVKHTGRMLSRISAGNTAKFIIWKPKARNNISYMNPADTSRT